MKCFDIRLWFFIVVIFSGLGLTMYGRFNSPDLISTERHETLIVEQKCPVVGGGICGGGSGSYLGNGLVLTARHVVVKNILDPKSERSELVVKTFDGTVVDAVVVFVSENTDYAIIRIPPIKEPAVHLSCRAPVQDEPITVVGNPGLVVDFSITHGTVASDRRWDDQFFSLSTGGNLDLTLLGWQTIVSGTAPVMGGNSGGPVFDAGGNQIGLVVGGNKIGDGFIPASTICSELPRL